MPVIDAPKYLTRLALIDEALKSDEGLRPYEFAEANGMNATTVYRYLGWIEIRCGLTSEGKPPAYRYRNESLF